MVAVGLTVEQICRLVKGTTTFDQSFCIDRLTSLSSATDRDMAVVIGRGSAAPFADVDRAAVAASSAALILAEKPLVDGKAFLLVDDSLHAYTQIVQFVQQQAGQSGEQVSSRAYIADDVMLGDGVRIEPYAVIKPGAHIGSYVRIGAGSVIGAGAFIGDATSIAPNVTVGDRCVIGSGSIVHSGVVIGSDGFGYQAAATGLRKIAHIGIVRIGNHVEIGAGCCIDRAMFDETVIGDGVKMDNLIHVAHNVKIGPATAILAHTGIAGSVTIGAGCQIGGQVAIKDHLTIGDRARIVSKSAVVKDVAAGETVCGQPATNFRKWKRTLAALNALTAPVQQRAGGMKQWSSALWHRVANWLEKSKQ